MKLRHVILQCFFLWFPFLVQCQVSSINNDVESIYHKALSLSTNNRDSAVYWLTRLEHILTAPTPVQKAKWSYATLKILYPTGDQPFFADSMGSLLSRFRSSTDTMCYIAHKYLERSMPDRAIPLLLQALQQLPPNSDSSDHVKIELSEAYRQKQEYAKGVNMLYDLLYKPGSLSDQNRAYAYNRLAALYNEWSYPPSGYTDSVIIYSNRCVDLSGSINNLPDLATSLNELSLQYLLKNDYTQALSLSQQAVEGFIASSLPFCAMNALIVQSNIYLRKKDFPAALRVMDEATKMAPIWENRNLYRRIYQQYANIYATTGNYHEAYEFLNICHHLQVDFFKDRINSQINEQSARYDLLMKEQKIREEKEKNQYKQRQIILLTIIVITLLIAFIISFFYFRLKRQEAIKQNLIDAVVETETNERRRIARELHDGLGPVLSAINHYFQAFLDAKPESREMIQSRLQMVIAEAIDEVSRISHNISPHVLESHGLVTAINNLVAPLNASNKCIVEFLSGFDERINPKIELTAYRCITELLNNTLKHASATRITIHLNRRNNQLQIMYADNGIGFDLQAVKPGGMGLFNIRNRIESFGGSLSIRTAPSHGITVDISIPFSL